jgi:hypothetical protein
VSPLYLVCYRLTVFRQLRVPVSASFKLLELSQYLARYGPEQLEPLIKEHPTKKIPTNYCTGFRFTHGPAKWVKYIDYGLFGLAKCQEQGMGLKVKPAKAVQSLANVPTGSRL